VILVACGVCCFDGATCFAVALIGQGLVSGVAPVISDWDDGRSQRFLFCLHASALAFFSIQPGLRSGLGLVLHGAVGVGAGVGCEVDGVCCAWPKPASKAAETRSNFVALMAPIVQAGRNRRKLWHVKGWPLA
jgi:hypothetical protein